MQYEYSIYYTYIHNKYYNYKYLITYIAKIVKNTKGLKMTIFRHLNERHLMSPKRSLT